eukprot:5310304-Lingulodinium_polyedra.AAC.1
MIERKFGHISKAQIETKVDEHGRTLRERIRQDTDALKREKGDNARLGALYWASLQEEWTEGVTLVQALTVTDKNAS